MKLVVEYLLVLFSLSCIVAIYMLQEQKHISEPARLEIDLASPTFSQQCLLVSAYEFVKRHPLHFPGGTCVRHWGHFAPRAFPRFPIRECPFNGDLLMMTRDEHLPVVTASYEALAAQSFSTSIVWQPLTLVCRFVTAGYFKVLKSAI
jgi:hypothetical protein